MLLLTLVFILRGWFGCFITSGLSYERKPLPALESKFASCPKCFNTCPHLSICANSRTGKDVRKPWTSTACQCWPPCLLLPSGFFLEDIDCVPQRAVRLVSTWVRHHVWARFLGCVYRTGMDEALESEHQGMHNFLPGYLASVGSRQGQGGVRPAAGNHGVS